MRFWEGPGVKSPRATRLVASYIIGGQEARLFHLSASAGWLCSYWILLRFQSSHQALRLRPHRPFLLRWLQSVMYLRGSFPGG